MRGADTPRSIGELVRLSDGAAWPLALPITLIGSGEQCDVRLADVAELHCALTLTPAGLALRSWIPETTLLGDVATAAALLSDGQEIRIGEELFKLSWNAVADSAEPVSTPELLEQLQAGREKFRLERKRIEADLDRRAKRLDKEAKRLRDGERGVAAEHKRVRAIYQRCLLRIKTRWATERNAMASERANHEASEARFRDFAERKKTELERLAAQLADDKVRLQASWELLTEGQRRAIADRREAQDWIDKQRDALDLRAKMFHEQQKLYESNRLNLDGKQPALIAEIAGLEARATHLRQTIAQLEAKRQEKLAAGERIDSFPMVSLEPNRVSRGDSNKAISLLGELQLREQELAREKQTLANDRGELESQAADLADQRAVLAEQIAALTAARELWHTAESQTVDELHSLALGVRSREQSLDERERAIYSGERRRRSEDHALAELRFKLENWQVALAAKENSVQAEADRLESQLNAKQEQMDRWESSLGMTAASWASLRQREIAFLHAELNRLAIAHAEQLAATAEARQIHGELTRQLADVAARDLALTGDSRGSTRRVRVLEKRWMAHFGREEKRLTKLDEQLREKRRALDERDRSVQLETAAFLQRQEAASVSRTEFDRERLAAERELREARDEADMEAQLRFQTEEDARRLRGEIARMAQSILTANLSLSEESDAIILPLKAVQAA